MYIFHLSKVLCHMIHLSARFVANLVAPQIGSVDSTTPKPTLWPTKTIPIGEGPKFREGWCNLGTEVWSKRSGKHSATSDVTWHSHRFSRKPEL